MRSFRNWMMMALMFVSVGVIIGGTLMALYENPRLAAWEYRFADKMLPGIWGKLPRNCRFPLVTLKSMWTLPRVRVRGRVQDAVATSDGDIHINITDGSKTIVAEIVPEFPMRAPPKDARIEIWGFARHDDPHGWWEIHPVIGWHLIKPPPP